MIKFISDALFRLWGWEMEGQIPEDIDRCVMIVAPHTSNVDFFIGLAASFRIRLPIYYLIKEEWLKNIFVGKLIRTTGAIGVSRSERKKMVDQLADFIGKKDKIAVVFPPEGTRKQTQRWKTGFYYVALRAKVPIVFVALDYRKKVVSVGSFFVPTGDLEKDMEVVREAYRGVTARYPKNFSLPVYISPSS